MRVSLTIRNFIGPRPGLKSGPDVFADALVPSGRIRPRNVGLGWSVPTASAPGVRRQFPPLITYGSWTPITSVPSAVRLVSLSIAGHADLYESKGLPPVDRLPEIVRACHIAPGAATHRNDAGISAMVIVPRNRKVNRTSRFPTSPCAPSTFAILRMPAALGRLHPVHREP